MRPSHSLPLLLACMLGACSVFRSGTPDNEPTIKTLAKRSVAVDKEQAVAANSDERAIEAYRKFLALAPRAAPQSTGALRRIGDLEMESADHKSANGEVAEPDYRVAIARYEEFLKAYPNDPSNDRVLYQLARAYEEGGNLEVALQTLNRLVKDYPTTSYKDEAQFRRGELLFTAKDYTGAEKAYQIALNAGPGSPYRDRSLYMHGWALFKQGRLDEALASFFDVLDAKVAGHDGDGGLDSLQGLSRADRELVEDTFRVTSISLANLQGAAAIAPFMNTPTRHSYEYRVYDQLGELYLKQDRSKDAADTFSLFATKNPMATQTPQIQARVIEIYERSGFGNLALDAKKDFVARYGAAGEFHRVNAAGWERAQPLVKTRLAELANYYHVAAQKSKNAADYQEAARWYRSYLEAFPSEPQTVQFNFLLAELLYEDGHYAEASVEYEKTAYSYPKHEKSADAGYAALLSYAQQQKKASPAEVPPLQRASIASALRFAQAFPADLRVGSVLSDAAEKLYALHDTEKAGGVAQRVLDLQPPAAEAQRRVAYTVAGHAAFERSAFDQSEKNYAEALKLTPATDKGRADLVERHAASIYKQGEQARAAGKSRDAVAHFARIGAAAPQSAVRASAQYDAAASLIALKDWDGAARTLEDFRQRFPTNPLQGEVTNRLAAVYIEQAKWSSAAAEFERISAASKDPKVARDALWQAAEFYEKGNARPAATKAYERYVAQNPQPLVPAMEARARLAKMAKEDGNPARELALMKDILQADQAGGPARTDRTKYLGATAALALADPVAAAYRQVALVEPLQRQLKLKRQKMDEALKAYAVAAEYGVADVTTAATYDTAAIYRDFSKALMASERPAKLSKVELEQYNVLLEEQAFPFEEKATELHEINARRAASGIYDQWVKNSFAALRELRPVRYGKNERSEGIIDAIR